MNWSISYSRMVFILVGLALGVATFCLSQPLTGNVEALRILVTVFSILAAILIAVITMLGDPKTLYKGSWRVASAHRRQIHKGLMRYTILFYIYLAVVTLAFIATLLARVTSDEEIIRLVERIAFSTGVAALFWSFGLPTAIIQVQKDRLDEEVERRRNDDPPKESTK